MPQKNAEPEFRSSIAGYYSHTQGARYVNPFSSDAKFPMLVELHESLHEYLACGNSTDALGRLYTGVLAWEDGLLRPDHRQSINELLQTIHENTVNTHELVATYLSLLLFSSRHPEDVSAARAELDDFYQEVLQAAEAAFGGINDTRLDASIITATLACAVAALCPPFPTEIVRFHRLSDCRQFVEQNSPDRRMGMFLQGIRPAWHQESIFSSLHDGLNSADIQATVWLNLRSRFPSVESVTDRPTILREWMTILKEDAINYSYKFLEDKEVSPNAEDTVAEKLGARFELPEVKDDEPLDLSLLSTDYVSGSLTELATLAGACAGQGLILHCHVTVIVAKNRAELKCFALNSAGKHAALPIGMEVAFDELVGTLANLPRGSLAIKIDELWGLKIDQRSSLSVAAMLAATNHPVFVLVNDSHPRNLRRLVQKASQEQKVSLCPLLGEDAYGVLLVYLHKDRYVIASPTTELGLEVLFHEFEDSDAIVFAVTEAVIPIAMGLSMAATASLMKNCFFKGPPRFDFKKIDHADLLQGIYDQPASPRRWWRFWRKA